MYKKVNRRINYLIKKYIYNIKSIIWSNFFQDIIVSNLSFDISFLNFFSVKEKKCMVHSYDGRNT